MIVFMGDTHGLFKVVHQIQNQFPDPNTIFIHVGDFGFYPELAGKWERERSGRPIYFIDGNHEYLPDLVKHQEVTEVWPGAFYVPRGTVLTLDGKRIAFMGGAASVDKAWRTPGIDWFPEEQITRQDVIKLMGNLAKTDDPNNDECNCGAELEKVDILVCHTPPDDCIQANFDPMSLAISFHLPVTWRDPSAAYIESIINRIKPELVVAGHMHRSLSWKNVQVLDINSHYTVP